MSSPNKQEIDELIQELEELTTRQREVLARIKSIREVPIVETTQVATGAKSQPGGYETGDSEEGSQSEKKQAAAQRRNKYQRPSSTASSVASSSVEVVGVIRHQHQSRGQESDGDTTFYSENEGAEREPIAYTTAELSALKSGCTLWTSAFSGKRYIIHKKRRAFRVGDIVRIVNPTSLNDGEAPTIRDGTGVVARVTAYQVIVHTDSGQDVRRGKNNIRYLSAEKDEQFERVQPVQPGRRPQFARYHA